MQMMIRSLANFVVIFVLAVVAHGQTAEKAAGPTLNWGDSAPPLKVSKWFKGTPIERFEPGRTYVVEFWATWCGPCKAAMPHLSELAKKYEGKITFIGVDVWENGDNPLPAVEQFVNGETGKSMQYNVAADSPPTRDGAMAKAWLAAAGMRGIPATFVIHDGKVAWTGHPDNVAPVLEQIVNNTYDLTGTQKAAEARDAEGERITALVRAATEKVKAKDYAGVLAVADSEEGKALTGRSLEWVQRAKFAALLHTDEAKALEFGREVARTTSNTIHQPRMMALVIVDTAAQDGVKLSKETYALGAEWLDGCFAKAPALTGNPDFSMTRAACHFGTGDAKKALELIGDAAKTNTSNFSEHAVKRNPVIEKSAKQYAAAAGVPVPPETTAEAQAAGQALAKAADDRAKAAGPPKLYDEKADAKQQIASAIETAKQSNKRVLIEWGGNWCGWCIRLNELFKSNADIAANLKANYILVHVDAGKPMGKNIDLAKSYKADLMKAGFPFLTVLDGSGNVIANQPSGELEAGGSIEQGHDPKKVLAFLSANAAGEAKLSSASVPATLPASVAQADVATAQLKLIESGAQEMLGGGYLPIRAELMNEKPATIKKLPADITAPIFGELAFAGQPGAHYHVVFDAPKSEDARLFVDSNGDGDLTNDPPATWTLTNKAEGKKKAWHGGEATIDLGTPDRPYKIRINLACEGDSYDVVYRHPDYATAGDLNLNGKTYRVMLNDQQCGGNFSGSDVDPESPFPLWPQFLIDINGDNKFAGKEEIFNVINKFTIGDSTYKLAEISKDGTSLKVKRIGDQTAADESDDRKESPIREARTRRANSVGKPFELAFTDATSGKPVDLQKDLKGKVVVIDFWATWCGPCVAEMPKMKELYAQFKDKGVAFIGVSLDGPDERGGLKKLQQYVREHDIAWPQFHVYGKGADQNFASGWGVTSIPSVFVIDHDGKLASSDARGKLETLLPELVEKRDRSASTR